MEFRLPLETVSAAAVARSLLLVVSVIWAMAATPPSLPVPLLIPLPREEWCALPEAQVNRMAEAVVETW